MRPLNQLEDASMTVLKIALDNFQRYEVNEPVLAAPYQKIVLILLQTPALPDVWGLRSLLSEEDMRRANKHVSVKVVRAEDAVKYETLSPQERRVLHYVEQGFRPQDAADLLAISVRTFVNHKQNIAAKLGLGSVRDLARFARSVGEIK